ncbi:hypothetical protein ACIOWF_20210 [Cellulosimicrobium cellulans]|uniref:hypothetical protein n=1 Tax=Cellulosimicrobium cellulans TaxID=1710 RepID=UPI00380829DA
MDEPFDLSVYIDSLRPIAPEQRAAVDDAMTGVQEGWVSAAFLRDVALYLTTLVLVGGVTTFEDDTWLLIDTIRHKHRGTA